MDSSVYAVEAEVEATHWWFDGRRRLFSKEISRLGYNSKINVLDIGTSTGTNLRMLRDSGFTNVTGLDMSEDAARFCEEKNLGKVLIGDVQAMPFDDEAFDLVLATDILEHVDDDKAAAREIARVLKPGGHVLISVPAFQSLWGLQDDVSQHKRRYRLEGLLPVLQSANLQIKQSYYFNVLLFAPIWLARQIIKYLNIKLKSENQLNSSPINAIFKMLFRCDVALAPIIRPPFGVSILAICRKSQEN